MHDKNTDVFLIVYKIDSLPIKGPIKNIINIDPKPIIEFKVALYSKRSVLLIEFIKIACTSQRTVSARKIANPKNTIDPILKNM